MKYILIYLFLGVFCLGLKAQEQFNQALANELKEILASDQKHRNELIAIQEKHGRDSEEVKAKWKVVHEIDSINLVAVNRILDEYGWLGADVLGKEGNIALFVVIQHADLDTQARRLPMLRKAVEEGNARKSSLALLEDRVAMRQGRKQIYGSQLNTDPETGKLFLFPMVDPDKVNERRAEMGLGTIEEYIAYWGLKWDVAKHKKRVAAFEEEGG